LTAYWSKASGENNLGSGNFLVEQASYNSEAVQAGHLDIEEDEIRAVLASELDGLKAVSSPERPR